MVEERKYVDSETKLNVISRSVLFFEVTKQKAWMRDLEILNT